MDANIYDVARMAGVSIATVSRVVNGNPHVTDKTRQKVEAVMEECGYTPNVFARGLSMNSIETIGILCPDISDLFVSRAVKYLEVRLHRNHYDCILGCSGYDQKGKELHAKLLKDKKIDALILIASAYTGRENHPEDVAYIRKIAEDIPVFAINSCIEGENIYCTYGDDYHAVYEVTKEYLNRGKKKILFLCDDHSYSVARKMNGYEAALRDSGMPVSEELKLFTDERIHNVRDELLARTDLDFDSVIAVNDFLAVGALKYAKKKGLRVPEDLFITGYNNSALSIGCDPELTSIDNNLEKMCSHTVKNMLKVLGGSRDVPAMTEVPYEIRKRETFS